MMLNLNTAEESRKAEFYDLSLKGVIKPDPWHRLTGVIDDNLVHHAI